MNKDLRQMKNSKGFTLIELLVSMLLMGLALGGAFLMQTKLAQSSQDTSALSQGVFLASELIESMSANPAGLRFYQEQLKDFSEASDVDNFCATDICAGKGLTGTDSVACGHAVNDTFQVLCSSDVDGDGEEEKQSSAASMTELTVGMWCGSASGSGVCDDSYCAIQSSSGGGCQSVDLNVTWSTKEFDDQDPITATVTMRAQL